MKFSTKFIPFIVVFAGFNPAFSQKTPSRIVKSEVKILRNDNSIKEQRNSMIEFGTNKKTSKNEIKLKIDRIIRNVRLAHTEAIGSDTLRYDGESFTIDTDNPLPTGEHDKTLIESSLKFTGKTIIFNENESGYFIGPKIAMGSPNIEARSNNQLPALNKNNFLSGLILNFRPETKSKVDTVISESYNGIFITTYSMNSNGFVLNGKYVPLKKSASEGSSEMATTIYDKFIYNGSIINKDSKIEKMELVIQMKSRIMFRGTQINENNEEKYKVVINNN